MNKLKQADVLPAFSVTCTTHVKHLAAEVRDLSKSYVDLTALCVNMSKTLASTKFNVEGEQGCGGWVHRCLCVHEDLRARTDTGLSEPTVVSICRRCSGSVSV